MDNVAREIIPEIDPVFPDLPIEARYTREFLRQCVKVEDDADVQIGDIYDPETGTFSRPEPPHEDEPDDEPYQEPEEKEEEAEE